MGENALTRDDSPGIAPASAPGFIVAQLASGLLAVIAIRALYPRLTAQDAAAVVTPEAP